MAKIITLSDSEFDETVLKTKKTILVDFWAQWCSPCLTMATILEEIASETSKDILIVKINIDENPEVPSRFRVRSIPTLMILKEGDVVATAVGPLSKPKIEAFIDENIV